MAYRCEAGHEIPEARQRRGGLCPACRIASVAAQVAVVDPTLDRDLIAQAIEAVVTTPAALRELFAALADGPEALVAGAPAVVGRLIGELVARGSRLGLPACSICASSARPLIRSGAVGVCPRCRSHQLAAACAGCGQVRRVYGRDAEGRSMCWACAKRPERVCGVCGRLRPMAERGRDGHPDVCNDCYRRPIATCQRCGHRRRCNFVAAGHAICGPCSPRALSTCAHCGLSGRPQSVGAKALSARPATGQPFPGGAPAQPAASAVAWSLHRDRRPRSAVTAPASHRLRPAGTAVPRSASTIVGGVHAVPSPLEQRCSWRTPRGRSFRR
jgi:hypothetical protein